VWSRKDSSDQLTRLSQAENDQAVRPVGRSYLAVGAVLVLTLAGCGLSEPTSDDPPVVDTREQHDDPGKDRQKKKAKGKARQPTKADKPDKADSAETLRSYPVLGVIDGDTVEVGYRGGVSVRIIGIDTPETVHPSVADECWGQVASNAATRLLSGRRVSLRFDASQGRLDAYGRTLGYLGIRGVGDFGLAMVKRGHAAEYTYDVAYRNQGKYQAAEQAARATGRGLWGKCGGPDKSLAASQPKPKPRSNAAPGPNCEPGYDPCVPLYPPDVDCADVDGPISVTGSDPHALDADGDGLACE